MLQAVRERIGDLVETLSTLDALLADERAEGLPGMQLARMAVALDEAAGDLALHADNLQASARDAPGGKEAA